MKRPHSSSGLCWCAPSARFDLTGVGFVEDASEMIDRMFSMIGLKSPEIGLKSTAKGGAA